MSERTSEGRGILSTLLIVFVVLKLANLVEWSWWWVLAPLWVPAFIALFVLAAFLVFGRDDAL